MMAGTSKAGSQATLGSEGDCPPLELAVPACQALIQCPWNPPRALQDIECTVGLSFPTQPASLKGECMESLRSVRVGRWSSRPAHPGFHRARGQEGERELVVAEGRPDCACKRQRNGTDPQIGTLSTTWEVDRVKSTHPVRLRAAPCRRHWTKSACGRGSKPPTYLTFITLHSSYLGGLPTGRGT